MIVYYNEKHDSMFIGAYDEHNNLSYCASGYQGEPTWTPWYRSRANNFTELRAAIKNRGAATIIHDDGEP